jgi:hypothetical protein
LGPDESRSVWPKGIVEWTEASDICLSVPFTWLLPEAIQRIRQTRLWRPAGRIVVGGPAVRLMPGIFDHVVKEGLAVVEESRLGVLQRHNPLATRTTVGCLRKCPFCAVPKTEGPFIELDDWPDFPVVIDNNILASSPEHFDRVCDRLERWGWADFNQGLDCRLLDGHHAERLKRIGKAICRLSLDSEPEKDPWERAFSALRGAGIAKHSIRSYVLVGFDTSPDEAWARCRWVEGHGVKALPMWFHPLDALERNVVTEAQASLGWNDYERRRIMQWFYQHKEAVLK